MKFTHFLFDLDGTISDSSLGIIKGVQYAFRELNLPQPDPSMIEIGPPILSTIKNLLEDLGSDDLYEKAVIFYRKYYSQKGLHEYSLYNGLPALIKSLHTQGASLYVATGKIRIYAKEMICLMKMDSHFKAIYGSELNGDRTDKSELLAHIIKTERLPAENTIMIGDRKHDIIAAKAVGLKSIGVLWGYGSQEELKISGADWVCQTPSELFNLIIR